MQTQQRGIELPTTYDFFVMLKSLTGKETAYGVAKAHGWNATTVRRWEKRHSVLDDDHIQQVAAALNLDPGDVAACVSVERISNDKLANQLRTWLINHGTAAALILAVFTAYWPAPAVAAVAKFAQPVCILCQIASGRLRRLARRLMALSAPVAGSPGPVPFVG